jgi:hypothetical protein
MSQVLDGAKTRKLIVQLVSGAVAGALVTFFFLKIASSAADFDDPSRLAAVAAGIVYLLMGGIVAIGAMAPNAGAKFLNVEDAAEIAAVDCLLVGLFFIALAVTPGGDRPGALSHEVAAYVAAAAFAGLVAASLWMRGRIDEFNKQLATESSALAFHISVLLFGGWAALAHLGYAAWIAPLGLLAGFALVQLAAMFWVIGRRGLLMPR